MNKNKIRLTETQLHKVINESLKRILRENIEDEAQKNNPKMYKKGKVDKKKLLDRQYMGNRGMDTVNGHLLSYTPEDCGFDSNIENNAGWNLQNFDPQECATHLQNCLTKIDDAREYCRKTGNGILYNLLNAITGEIYQTMKELGGEE